MTARELLWDFLNNYMSGYRDIADEQAVEKALKELRELVPAEKSTADYEHDDGWNACRDEMLWRLK